jgi:BlaI family transcriptional regulator, penicillinase repressor
MQFMVLEKQHFKKAGSNFLCCFSNISIAAFPASLISSVMSNAETLARRERQVMEILYRKGEATAQEVMDEMADPPTYSAVRALLATMMEKGLISHRKDSRRYVYRPEVPEKKAKRSALKQLLSTFFEGSPEKLVAALLDPKDQQLSNDEIAKIRSLIHKK